MPLYRKRPASIPFNLHLICWRHVRSLEIHWTVDPRAPVWGHSLVAGVAFLAGADSIGDYCGPNYGRIGLDISLQKRRFLGSVHIRVHWPYFVFLAALSSWQQLITPQTGTGSCRGRAHQIAGPC